MIAHQRKRARSPSPPFDHLASPLDGLLKRRRQRGDTYADDSNEYMGYAPQHSSPLSPYPYMTEGTLSGGAEGSTTAWPRFVEKRRTRQWEKLNAPQYHLHSNGESSSQPHNYPLDNSSPLRPKSFSQPTPARAPMSSSPIRHAPPPSSPFRAIHREEEKEEREAMDEEEMKKEWGEEYYAQNSLLHNLHMTRAHPPHQPDPAASQIISTPDYTLLQTPGASGSSYFPAAPYRTTAFPPSSSPYPSQTHTMYSSNTQSTPDHHGHGAYGMEVDVTPDRRRTEAEEEVGRRYEETNRLLAELEVVRRQRWGEGS